ncbi:MAG: hypothetical protein L6R39_002120 [Caloplaca ligustica]|nr:MAG: hypothetical protein L6R39_002120 [Caloplaca ligustica]
MAKRSREDSPPAGATGSPLPSSPSPSVEPNPLPASAAIDDTRSTKYLQVSDEPTGKDHVAMKCSLAPHSETITFSTFEEFEVHYAQVHTNRCSECHKNFPTEHFLGLHISENHDPLVAARRARDEKTYRCFVEGCDKVCSTPLKRKWHLQAKHFFPKDYDYFIVNDGIDKRSSMLRTRHRRGSSAASRALQRGYKGGRGSDKPTSLDEVVQDQKSEETRIGGPAPRMARGKDSLSASTNAQSEDMEELTSTMSALKFVPSSVRFGRGGRPAGLARH